MFDTRIIRRLAYDGNYRRAIELIVDIIDEKKNYFEVKEDLEKRRKTSSIIRENARLKSCLQEIKKECHWVSECGVTNDNMWGYDNILDLITKAEEE